MKHRFASFLFGVFFLLLSVVSAAETGAYRVMFLGDVHYDALEYHHAGYRKKRAFKRNVTMWESASPQLLKAAGEQAGKDNVAFVVQLGDITQGYSETPELQEKMLRTAFLKLKPFFADRPLLAVKGNHDVRVRSGNDNGPAERGLLPLVAAEKGLGKLSDGNCAFMQDNDLFIAVDGFVGMKPVVEFVRKSLEAHPDARYVFLMTHLPVLPASAQNPIWLLPGYEEIAAMLETKRALVIAAHTHRLSVTTRTTPRGTLPQLIVSSMGCSWHPDKLVPDPLADWEKFAAAAGKNMLKGRNSQKIRQWRHVTTLGQYAQRRDFMNSGFAILDVNDERVEARVFTNMSGAPTLTLKLVAGPASRAAR